MQEARPMREVRVESETESDFVCEVCQEARENHDQSVQGEEAGQALYRV